MCVIGMQENALRFVYFPSLSLLSAYPNAIESVPFTSGIVDKLEESTCTRKYRRNEVSMEGC